jgi:hypothetical protein
MDFLIAAAVVVITSLLMLSITTVFYFIMLGFLISLGLIVLWIITLIDCVRRDNKDFAYGGKDAKVLWFLYFSAR